MSKYDNLYWNDYVATTYNINRYRNGIELSFAKIPPEVVRLRLKRNGWKWSSSSSVWYIRYSEEALQFAKNECSLTEKRRELISKMPAFYRNNCGYSEEQLLNLSKYLFDEVAKYGTLKSIAKEILLETLPDSSLSYLTELYLRVMRDEEYREEFIKKIPKEYYRVSPTGKRSLYDDYQNSVLPEKNGTESILDHLMLKQTRFWETLTIFGGELTPIDRTAFAVSNYHNHYVRTNNIDADNIHACRREYWKPISRKEYHLFQILNSLTLDYDDLLTRTIKLELQEELRIALSSDDSNNCNYYLLAIYSNIIGNDELTSSLLDKLIAKESAKSIILKKKLINT